MIIVSDTSPICYLLLIGHIDVLQELYGIVTIPQVVAARAGLLDLATTFESLQQAGFRVAPNLLEQLLRDD